MYYFTIKQSPQYHQMTLEEFLFGSDDITKSMCINTNDTNTRTYAVERISDRVLGTIDIPSLVNILVAFNEKTEPLRQVPRRELYREFYIPKKSGGLRKIDAPNDDLMRELRLLKTIFEDQFHTLYHTAAFAYVQRRNTIDCMKRHQENKSNWYAKYDLHNFFGSVTLDYTMRMLSMIFPFSEIVKTTLGRNELRKALELGFLDGGLPQGTPLSPMLTNLIMIPIDYTLANALRDYNGQRFVYTRYADDFQVSSKYTFNFREIEQLIIKTLAEFEAPFEMNTRKTRYGSRAGSNWNLGVMVNKDNNITVGYKNKRRFQAMLASYIMDKKNGTQWNKNDVQVMEGTRNYYKMVEGETIDRIIAHINQKFGVDVVAMIRQDLKAAS